MTVLAGCPRSPVTSAGAVLHSLSLLHSRSRSRSVALFDPEGGFQRRWVGRRTAAIAERCRRRPTEPPPRRVGTTLPGTAAASRLVTLLAAARRHRRRHHARHGDSASRAGLHREPEPAPMLSRRPAVPRTTTTETACEAAFPARPLLLGDGVPGTLLGSRSDRNTAAQRTRSYSANTASAPRFGVRTREALRAERRGPGAPFTIPQTTVRVYSLSRNNRFYQPGSDRSVPTSLRAPGSPVPGHVEGQRQRRGE